MHHTLIYISLMGALFLLLIIWTIVCCVKLICNTPSSRRSIHQRPMPHTESRARLIQSTQELPTCVSYFDMPAPPKFERVDAPPSYEEAVGIHRCRRQQRQPITQPIATALAQTSQSCTTAQTNYNRSNDSTSRSNDSAARNTDSSARSNTSVARNNDTAARNNDSVTTSNDRAFIVTINEIPIARSTSQN